MGEFVGGRIVPKHCGAWNKNSKYEMLSIVYQPETGDSYISRKSVPAGTALSSEEYWAICSEYSAQVRKLEQDVDADVEQMHTDLTQTKADMSREFSETHVAMSKELTDTHTAISQELTETESRMQESLQQTTETLSGKVEQAQTDLNTGRKELNDAKTTLNKRMDSIAGGMTADSEILDARVDNQGTTHASLGEAMRSAEKTRGLWDDWLTTIVSQLLDEATGRETKELTFDSTIRTFINLNGTVGTLANESDSHWHTSEMIPVVAGHVYIITASSGWKKYYYAFYDSDENVLAGEIAPDNKSGKIENRIVIAPVGAVSMRITWIQVSNFMGKVEEVTRFLFPTNELNEKPESRMVAVETGLEKAKADLIAAATGEQNTLLSAAVVEGEAVEFTYTANRCINEKAGEVVPLSNENTAFRVSEPIPVSPGELYAFTVSGGWSKYLYAFYDENDKVVGGFQQETDMIRTYYDRISPVPATAATVRIAWVENNHFTGVIKKVTRISYPSAELVGTAAEQAAERDSRISGLENYLASKIVDENYEYAIGEAVKVTENNGMLLNPTTGAIVKEPTGNTNYRLSEPITVEPYTPYCISAAGKAGYGLYAFYDVNGNRVGGENNTGNTDRKIENKVVTSPARAVSIRVACINGMQSCGIQPMTRGYFIGMKPKWYGRTWVCLGDSLTESNSRTTKHYFDYIAEKTGIKTVNLGVSGTGYMRRKDINRAFYQRVSDIPEDADVITIFGSGNDLSSDQTLGTVTDTGTDTICGCINATIDAIYERIPLARLGIVTPTPWVGSMPSKTTCGMAKYSEAIVEICKRRSIPCLDLYHESNLRPDDENFRKLAFSKDGGNGVHPDEKGHEIIAASFQSLLERLIL